MAGENRGISFYDPRRAQRYWSDRNSRHVTLEKALEMLAHHYGRSVEWIEDHMGEENDLGVIHANLSRFAASEDQAIDNNGVSDSAYIEGAKPPPPQPLNGSSPGRSDSSKDNFFSSAAPATETGRRYSAPQSPPSAAMSTGILFYDPRRLEKYWAGQNSRHTTLQQAIQALALQYGVASDWIEAHLGNSNDLAEIHRNIQESLQKPPD